MYKAECFNSEKLPSFVYLIIAFQSSATFYFWNPYNHDINSPASTFLPLDFSLEFLNLEGCAVHSERMSPSYSSFYSQDLIFASRFILFL